MRTIGSKIKVGKTHCIPKIPEHLRLYKNSFPFPVIYIKMNEQKFFDEVSLKYPNFNILNNSDKILFRFNNIYRSFSMKEIRLHYF